MIYLTSKQKPLCTPLSLAVAPRLSSLVAMTHLHALWFLVHTKALPPLHYNTRRIALLLRMLIADWHNHTHTDFYKYFFLTKQLLRAQQVLPCAQNDCCCFPPVAIYQLEAFDGNSSFCWHKMIISN